VALKKLVFNLPDILADLVESPLHPHEIISYGCIELLGWNPGVVVRSHATKKLGVLADKIKEKCLKVTPGYPAAVRQVFEDLRDRLERSASAELTPRSESATRYKALIERDPNRKLRDTELKDYFGEGAPKDEVAEWRDRGKRRIKEWTHA